MSGLVAVAAILAGDPALAQAPGGSPRAALHDNFGRMVFDWDEPVSYSADIVNSELVLRFSRPVKGDFRAVVRPLARYVSSVAVSADHQTATFPLTHPVQVKAYGGASNAVIIDLLDQPGPAEPQPAPSVMAPEQPAASADAPISLLPGAAAPAQPTTPMGVSGPAGRSHPPADAGAVDVRTGEHGSFNRVVFTWPQPVQYSVEKDGDQARISFARSGRIDLGALRTMLPSDIQVKGADAGGKGTVVTLVVPADARLRHFSSGSKVVVDVVRANGAEPPAGSGKVPLAPPPGGDIALPSLKPLAKEESPKLPAASLPSAPPPAAAAPPPAAPVPSPTALPAAGKQPPAPKTTARDATPPVAAKTAAVPSGDDKAFSLSVPWDKPVAAAVFRRAGYLWVVFDRKQNVDTALLRRLGGDAVQRVEQLPNAETTVLRLLVQPDYEPSVRKDGLLWVIDLTHQPMAPKEAIAVSAPAMLPNGVGISMAVAEAGNVVSVADPEVGDVMTVVPVVTLGEGVYPGRDTPDVEILPSVQGVALVPHVDGLDVRATRGSISISLPGSGAGMRLSSDKSRPMAAPKTSARDGVFDIPEWMKGGPDSFPEERRQVENDLALVPKEGLAAAHLEAARFFFANGFGAEALGYLRMAVAEDPSLENNGPFRAVRGASNVLMGRWTEAAGDLDSPLLTDDAESRMWQAAAHAGTAEHIGDYDKALAGGLAIFGRYPKPLAWPIAVLAARAALATGDDDTAQKSLDVLDRSLLSPREESLLDYLHGGFNEMAGHFDRALDDYAHAKGGDNREFRARAAMAETELLLRLGRISAAEAADRLDRLRFAWREEDFEFALLKRLAELQVQAGDYPNALRTMRTLAVNYPDSPKTPAVTQLMSDTFAKLYLGGIADTMVPVSAIALYDEFRDLTPTGPKGDEMIRKLADHLASVDLLDRAAELLKHQVNFRLQGLDKARVGAQLALLDLLNRQPGDALEALQNSETGGLPPDLVAQRRHLRARALADLDRVPDAIQLLVGDDSAEAAQLRAEIYWHKQDWGNAATALEALVPKPDRGQPLNNTQGRLLLSWATALVLANDERGLAALRRNYGSALTGTPYNEGFSLLTSALDRDMPDMPAIAAKIKEAEGFQTFMSKYKNQLRSSGLSGIN